MLHMLLSLTKKTNFSFDSSMWFIGSTYVFRASKGTLLESRTYIRSAVPQKNQMSHN